MKKYIQLSDIQQDLASNNLKLIDLVNNYINQIKTHQQLNAFVEVFEEEARLKAASIQEKIEKKAAGRLAGMVIGIKDNICYKNHKVSASSKILENFTSIYSSTVVERLLAEDAIILGRLNCDEFAMGASNETSYYGPVRNFANVNKVAGGSSGGSAVAVQAGLCLATLGTDTGGSVRQPASFCGVVGLKPTYGRVSRHGIIAYASSFDQVGPLANSVEDIALLLEIIAGKDEYDSTVSSKPVEKYSKQLGFNNKKKIAYLKEGINSKGLAESVKKTFEITIQKLKNEGHELEEVSFPLLDYAVPTYYVLTTAEASSNLARYDGVHYGYRSKNATDLESTYKKSRSEGFGVEVKRRIMLGTFVLSAGYYDAYYAKAQKVRRLITEESDKILSNFDFMLMPTAPTSAFNINEKITDPLVMYLADIFTVQASLAGLPAISLPAGKDAEDMPIGIQIVGKRFEEASLLSFAKSFEEMNKTI